MSRMCCTPNYSWNFICCGFMCFIFAHFWISIECWAWPIFGISIQIRKMISLGFFLLPLAIISPKFIALNQPTKTITRKNGSKVNSFLCVYVLIKENKTHKHCIDGRYSAASIMRSWNTNCEIERDAHTAFERQGASTIGWLCHRCCRLKGKQMQGKKRRLLLRKRCAESQSEHKYAIKSFIQVFARKKYWNNMAME